MKRILIIFAALLVVTTAAACKSSSNDGSGSKGEAQYVPATATGYYVMTTSAYSGGKTPVPSITVTQSAAADYNGIINAGSASIPDDRMIVRTGSISMVVNDISATLADIAQMAEGYGGYVVSSNTWKNGESVYGSISIRIPAEKYDTATQSVSLMAVEVTSQNTSSQDVTEEYVDLGAQLSTLEATEQQLLSIMAKATKIEDILAVQSQLTSIQTQIAQIKGRMQYLEKTSATSLISISLSQAKLKLEFNASSVNAKTGEELYFTPTVSGGFTPYSYEWDFGDGKTSTESNPSHAFAKPGDYTVSLTVTDDRTNTVTETRETYVKITQGGWSVGGVASGAWSALLWLGRGLVSVVIGLAVFSPVLLVVGGVIWLLRRRRKAKSA